MIGNPKLFRVWRELKDIPDRWVDVMEIGKITNLTCRQVSALINMLPAKVDKRYDPENHAVQIRLIIDPEEIEELDIRMREICCNHASKVRARDAKEPPVEERITIQTTSGFPSIDIQYKDRHIAIRKGDMRCQDVSDDL